MTSEQLDNTIQKFFEGLDETKKIAGDAMKAVNALSSKWGRFVEGLIAPGAILSAP